MNSYLSTLEPTNSRRPSNCMRTCRSSPPWHTGRLEPCTCRRRKPSRPRRIPCTWPISTRIGSGERYRDTPILSRDRPIFSRSSPGGTAVPIPARPRPPSPYSSPNSLPPPRSSRARSRPTRTRPAARPPTVPTPRRAPPTKRGERTIRRMPRATLYASYCARGGTRRPVGSYRARDRIPPRGRGRYRERSASRGPPPSRSTKSCSIRVRNRPSGRPRTRREFRTSNGSGWERTGRPDRRSTCRTGPVRSPLLRPRLRAPTLRLRRVRPSGARSRAAPRPSRSCSGRGRFRRSNIPNSRRMHPATAWNPYHIFPRRPHPRPRP
mmetsp:Transcript_16208/g.38849  ORF Transcript_16208/g.38849 Transcript_16208/m.38849 type:complete len:323 (+) Transcript_16208:422-1390(+)